MTSQLRAETPPVEQVAITLAPMRRRARLRWNRSMSSSVSAPTSIPRPSNHLVKANACLATMQA